jgi:inosine-uridine nucleoside N-ribohydrolase
VRVYLCRFAQELLGKWIAKLRQELIGMRPIVEIDGPIEDLPVVEDEEKEPEGERRPVKIILDTDIGPDCDDAGAIAVLHALADLGEIEILGMTCCTSSKWGPACIQAINTYYGRPEIVIGAYNKPGVLEEDRWSLYNKYIATNFPNAKRTTGLLQAPPAYMVMRELLVHNRNVIIVGIGPLTNLADLLDSRPDYHSPLTGRALIAQSVDKLVQMGGGFPKGEEFNFVTHPTAAKRVVERWPTEIVFSGMEIGGKLSAGEQLMRTPRTNPVRMAYQLHTQGWMKAFAFDHTAVIYAARGALYWTLSRRGLCQVGSTGENSWRSRPFGRHRYLVAETPAGELSSIIERLMTRFPKLARHEKDPLEDEVLVEELPVVPDEST